MELPREGGGALARSARTPLLFSPHTFRAASWLGAPPALGRSRVGADGETEKAEKKTEKKRREVAPRQGSRNQRAPRTRTLSIWGSNGRQDGEGALLREGWPWLPPSSVEGHLGPWHWTTGVVWLPPGTTPPPQGNHTHTHRRATGFTLGRVGCRRGSILFQ